ncbi:hypothetical protein Tsubulata_019025 [Turnera subulata]|uniref:F-box domain-containing protein n=1 Tax=Turnera subulata TaxID=218843 RepID=A0A9Q0FX57_9ROSI|nr:hypothetical protein Tsubulata_019025 [Turnera subulata]
MQSGGSQPISSPPPPPNRQPPPSSVSAANTVSYNEDLLRQILIHLPYQSLGKCRCVSKHWYSFISHLPPRIYNIHCGLLLLTSNPRPQKYDRYQSQSRQKYEYEYVPLDSTLGNGSTVAAPYLSVA